MSVCIIFALVDSIFNIPKWYEVKEHSYKLIYELAKERFEEYASESESITNKSIKIFTALIGIAAFIIGFILKKKIPLGNDYIFITICLLFAVALYCVYGLISPKNIYHRGIDPSIAANKDIFVEENKDYQLQATYYNIIKVLQNNINGMYDINEIRMKRYTLSLYALFSIIISVGLWVGVTYHP